MNLHFLQLSCIHFGVKALYISKNSHLYIYLWYPSVSGDNGVSAPESVCCGIAVPAVAEQSNMRAAESVAVATGEACDCFCGH